MQDEIVCAKAVRHYTEMARTQPQYTATRMAELAPGVVAVEDRSGECDVLFDKTQWRFVAPEIWENDSLLLEKYGLGVLEGGHVVHNIGAMANFIKEHLVPIGELSWHDKPLFFNPLGNLPVKINLSVRLKASQQEIDTIFRGELTLGVTYTAIEEHTEILPPEETLDPEGEHTTVRLKETMKWYDREWFVKA